MNPLNGQLITTMLPSSPSEVFEADMPDPSELAKEKAMQLLGAFGKYGSTKAEPYVSKLDDNNSLASNPKALAQAKVAELGEMIKSYGESKAAPYLNSIAALQANLPISDQLPIEEIFNAGSLDTVASAMPFATSPPEIPIEMTNLEAPTQIALMDEIGQPLAAQPYELKFAHGKILKGMTDENGVVNVPQQLKAPFGLSLPNMDKSAW